MYALRFVLLALAVAGVAALLPQLGLVWAFVALFALAVVAAAVAATRILEVPFPVVVTADALGSLVVSLFALLGVDWATAQFGAERLNPRPSVIVGFLIVLVAAFVYLRRWWALGPLPPMIAIAIAARVAFVLMIVPIGIVVLKGAITGDGSKLAQRSAVSQLDVVVLSAGGAKEDVVIPDVRGWRIHIWNGRVDGERVSWSAGGAPPVVPRTNTDRVLLLLPAATPEQDEVARWMQLADSVEARTTPTYAALDTTDGSRLQRWRTVLSRVQGREGDALPLRVGGRVQSVTELALRAAVLAPTADQDLALAVAHRPALFFDEADVYHRPLDVDQLLRSGRIRMCDARQKVRSLCSEVQGASDLRTGFEHLAFDPRELEAANVGSTIYVDVSSSGNGAPNAIYLDYWWYLPHNPAGSGSGAFCGAGLVIGGVTCFDHKSDWEGVTVVLDGDRPSAPPIAVNYAQHDGSTRYAWRALQKLWGLGERQRFGSQVDTRERPLVFVANGTHASYPLSCAASLCSPNPLPGIRDDSSFNDNRHDGGRPWAGNVNSACSPACVTALPTHRNGTEPASWNAWGGVWGTANCVLGVICSSSQPPRSPGAQGRYEEPWCFDTEVDFLGGHFVKHDGSCPPPKLSADDLTRGERLLALGDSYSSGEGAGDYDPNTNTEANSCHRSPNAWPRLMAHLRRLTPLPSLACSGALIDDLITGRRDGEPERRLGQIGRIAKDPNAITLTIGGNDTGFAPVLINCVKFDCVGMYHKAHGDVLDKKIEDVARHLPDVYSAIRRAAPRALLLVVDYPRLFPRPGAHCSAEHRISAEEAAYLNSKGETLDREIVGIAGRMGIEVIDVSDAFAGHELGCPEPYVNHWSSKGKLRSASFHPKASGQERLAELVSERLAALES